MPLETLSFEPCFSAWDSRFAAHFDPIFTVKDAISARKSVLSATWIIGIFYLMTVFLGFWSKFPPSLEQTRSQQQMQEEIWPPHCSPKPLVEIRCRLFVSAIAFATILAVVTGLVLSAASAFAHDFIVRSSAKGKRGT
ncbi:hypothetical protein ACEQPO_28440 [Bacillus sp. SL00103]